MNVYIKHLIIPLIVVLMLSVCILSVPQASGQTDQSASKLQAATTAVNQAFNAVLDAEKAGANVTDLLVQINTAEGILAQAENSYRSGDTNTATNQVNTVLPIAHQVTIAAQNAKQDAIMSNQNNFWLTIAFSVVGMIMFLEVLVLFWLWFKRRYIKNLSEAKPEVVDQ